MESRPKVGLATEESQQLMDRDREHGRQSSLKNASFQSYLDHQNQDMIKEVQRAAPDVWVTSFNEDDYHDSATATVEVPEEYFLGNSPSDSDFSGPPGDEECYDTPQVKVFSCERVGCQWPCEHHEHRFTKGEHSFFLTRTPKCRQGFA